jgi:cyclic pyranopterin phosphate synthase
MPPLLDRLDRPLRNLRLSVTDRCNLRCAYCMPEENYVWLPRESVLTFEEMSRLVDVFIGLGVDEVRLTGGEPLLRQDLEVLVAMLSKKPGIKDLALTTNGVLLADHAAALRAAGLHRITVSLDTLDAATFRMLSRTDDHGRVLAGIAAAAATGLPHLKLDTVVIGGVNDGEIADLLAFAKERGAELRFIEYMDVGGATQWRADRVVPQRAVLAAVERRFGKVTPLPRTDSAPANQFRLGDGTLFGIVASVTQPFCRTCDRSRLTADGMWYLCLYAATGEDLRALLRSGADDAAVAAQIARIWRARSDRGAEIRAALPDRRALLQQERLRADPHLEMHTRGG